MERSGLDDLITARQAVLETEAVLSNVLKSGSPPSPRQLASPIIAVPVTAGASSHTEGLQENSCTGPLVQP